MSRLPLLPLASVKPLLAAPRLALLPSFSSCSTLSRPSLLSPPPSSLSPRDSLLLFVYPSAFRRRRTTPRPPSFQLKYPRALSLPLSLLSFLRFFPAQPQTRFARSLPAKLSAAKFPLLFLLALFTLPTPLKRSPLCPLFLRFLLDKEQVVVVPFRKPPSFHLSLRFRFLSFSSLSLVFPRFNR